MKKNIWIHALVIVFMFLVACIYLSPALGGKIIRQGDIQKSDAMSYTQRMEKERTGSIPNWNESMFSGMPGYQITTEAPKSVFWPLRNALVMRHIGLERNIGVLFLYLIGFYVAMLAFGVSPWLALIGALGFGLGSYNIIIIEAGHITKAWAMSMMAPIFAALFVVFRSAIEDGLDKRKRISHTVWGSILFTLALILQISFNHIQITFYTAIGCVVMGIAYLVYAIIKRRIAPMALNTGILLVCAALAFGCNVRLLMVNEEYAKYTMRGGNELTVTPSDIYGESETQAAQNTATGLDIDYAFAWSYGVGETYTIMVPGAMGGGSGERIDTDKSAFYKSFRAMYPQYQYPWGNSAPLYWGTQPFTSGPVYFGAIIIFLFLFGLTIVRGPERWWLLIVTIVAILLSWGRNFMPLNEWLFNNMPLYNKFRTPSMSLVLANVCMAIMAMLAMKEIFNAGDSESERKRLNISLYCTAGSLVAIILVVLAASGKFSFAGSSDGQLPQGLADAAAEDRANLLKADSWRSIIFILLAACSIWLYINRKLKNAGIAMALVGLLTVVDLWGVDRRYLNNDNFVEENSVALRRKPYDFEIDKQASERGDHDYRVLNLAVNTFNDSEPSAFHNQVGGYSAAKLSRYQNLIDFYISRHINPRILAMLNTRYIVTQDGNVQRNPEALGNVWFVNEVKAVGNANEEILALNNFNPALTAVVDTTQSNLTSQNLHITSFDSSATIALEPQRLASADYRKYVSHSTTDRVAVFSEIHYEPDWFAYIDGKPAEYFRANYLLRAMVIPAGDHVIEFKNEAPRMHKLDNINLIISIITLLAIIGAIALVVLKEREEAKK